MAANFIPTEILLPRGVSMEKWSVVACDQYSSEPAYWERVEAQVGAEPSTLRMILPEAYLAGADMDRVAADIVETMDTYLRGGVLEALEESFVYIERRLEGGAVRRGLMGALDLESYDYTPGTAAPVRASENTVVDRLPPRIALRERAALEVPHVMVLMDDPAGQVLGPLAADAEALPRCYDFSLMERGGRITGYQVVGERAAAVTAALDGLAVSHGSAAPVQMIIGDGNHSLAAAKACWETVKTALPEGERDGHPARYALVELTNIHDTSLEIEPIHRAVFGAGDDLAAAFVRTCPQATLGDGAGYCITCLSGGEAQTITVDGLTIGETIGALQRFLDGAVEARGGEIDYIHGEAALRKLAEGPDCVGFLMPAVERTDLFPSVEAGGVFPKKSFSMGHAQDKRYYLECRGIRR